MQTRSHVALACTSLEGKKVIKITSSPSRCCHLLLFTMQTSLTCSLCLMSLQYAFNLFSHNSPMTENGYNEEEMKMVKETKKIWGTTDVAITATCIRVPIMRAHAESINLEFDRDVSEEEVRPPLMCLLSDEVKSITLSLILGNPCVYLESFIEILASQQGFWQQVLNRQLKPKHMCTFTCVSMHPILRNCSALYQMIDGQYMWIVKMKCVDWYLASCLVSKFL